MTEQGSGVQRPQGAGSSGTAGTPAPVGHVGTRVEIEERTAWSVSGWWGLLGVVVLVLAWLGLAATAFGTSSAGTDAAAALATALGVLLLVICVLVLASLVVIQPGQTRVVQFFGRYVGTVRRTGLVLLAPLTIRRDVSVRVNNFETARLKVNDADGNPATSRRSSCGRWPTPPSRCSPSRATWRSSRCRPRPRCGTWP